MKKLGLILFAALMTVFIMPQAKAQTSLLSANTLALVKTLDTVTGGASVKVMTTIRVAGPAQNVTISAVVVKKTGTAAGAVRLYGSLDGVNYSRIRSSSLQGASTAVDSLFVHDVTTAQVFHFPVINSPYQYYQLQATATGTTTWTVAGKYVAH